MKTSFLSSFSCFVCASNGIKLLWYFFKFCGHRMRLGSSYQKLNIFWQKRRKGEKYFRSLKEAIKIRPTFPLCIRIINYIFIGDFDEEKNATLIYVMWTMHPIYLITKHKIYNFVRICYLSSLCNKKRRRLTKTREEWWYLCVKQMVFI